MAVRTVIPAATGLFLIPGWLIALMDGPPAPLSTYIFFPLLFPFTGTCPFPIDKKAGDMMDMFHYWPVFAFLFVVGLGIAGFAFENKKLAAIFVTVLVLSWDMTFLRWHMGLL